ncbi:hypothetical protein ABK905_25370 [Acerihabitans sp. KWT182]|uniref:Uncharacterized protein n=1 Tax=Acerihabitans sp. KWT182 TaxID=3157919 RepID=A0AAU7Q955_9GAMM
MAESVLAKRERDTPIIFVNCHNDQSRGNPAGADPVHFHSPPIASNRCNMAGLPFISLSAHIGHHPQQRMQVVEI